MDTIPPSSSNTPERVLDLTDVQSGTCTTFTDVMRSGKLHAYLRILCHKGMLDVGNGDDDFLMSRFLRDPEARNQAENLWMEQGVIVNPGTSLNISSLAAHIRSLLDIHLAAHPVPGTREHLGRRVEWDDPQFLRWHFEHGDLDGARLTCAADYQGLGVVNFTDVVIFSPPGGVSVKGQTMVVWCDNHHSFPGAQTPTEIINRMLKRAFGVNVDITASLGLPKLSAAEVATALRTIEMDGRRIESSERFAEFTVTEVMAGKGNVGGNMRTVASILGRSADYATNKEGLLRALTHCHGVPVRLKESSTVADQSVEAIRDLLATTGTYDGKPCTTLAQILEIGMHDFIHKFTCTWKGTAYKGVVFIPNQSYEEWKAFLCTVFGEEASAALEKYEASRPMYLLKKPALLRQFLENGIVDKDGEVLQILKKPQDYEEWGVGNIAKSRRGKVLCRLDGYEDVKVASLMEVAGGQNGRALTTVLETAFGPRMTW